MLLSVAAAAVSGISLYHYVGQAAHLRTGPSFCNINEAFNCDAVNASVYATMLGIPIASYGVVFYLLLLVLSWNLDDGRGRTSDSLVFLTTFGVLYSVYLFLVSKLLIGVLCPTCMALYALNALLFISALARGVEQGVFLAFRSGAAAVISYPLRLARGGADRLTALLYGLPLAMTAAVVVLVPQTVIAASERRAAGARGDVSPVEQWRREAPIDISRYVATSGPDTDYVAGPPDAAVTIFEFFDFECPACKRFYYLAEEIAAERPGKVRLISKNYPLDSACNPAIRGAFHENSCLAVRYSRCAGEQGRYWEMARLIFDSLEISEEGLAAGAESLGLDRDALGECLGSERVKRKIAADLEHAEQLGIRGTPSIWINGKRLARFSPDALRTIVDELAGAR